jgi:hypothetical protein
MMISRLLHIFQNTPLGRETLLQAAYFTKQLRASLTIYIPRHVKFLMYFDNDVVQVDLDHSYLISPDTARDRAIEIAREAGVEPSFIEPKHFTASALPDIPTDFDFMVCPRSISNLSSKIGLGYIGPKVRSIVNAANFPVLIASHVYKPWKNIVVFFGGSANALNALKLGFRIQNITKFPLKLFTYAETSFEAYQKEVADQGIEDELNLRVEDWQFFESGNLTDNLYNVPHDALVILGAFSHGLIRDIVFGSKIEKIQTSITNNLLIVGSRYSAIV